MPFLLCLFNLWVYLSLANSSWYFDWFWCNFSCNNRCWCWFLLLGCGSLLLLLNNLAILLFLDHCCTFLLDLSVLNCFFYCLCSLLRLGHSLSCGWWFLFCYLFGLLLLLFFFLTLFFYLIVLLDCLCFLSFSNKISQFLGFTWFLLICYCLFFRCDGLSFWNLNFCKMSWLVLCVPKLLLNILQFSFFGLHKLVAVIDVHFQLFNVLFGVFQNSNEFGFDGSLILFRNELFQLVGMLLMSGQQLRTCVDTADDDIKALLEFFFLICLFFTYHFLHAFFLFGDCISNRWFSVIINIFISLRDWNLNNILRFRRLNCALYKSVAFRWFVFFWFLIRFNLNLKVWSFSFYLCLRLCCILAVNVSHCLINESFSLVKKLLLQSTVAISSLLCGGLESSHEFGILLRCF